MLGVHASGTPLLVAALALGAIGMLLFAAAPRDRGVRAFALLLAARALLAEELGIGAGRALSMREEVEREMGVA